MTTEHPTGETSTSADGSAPGTIRGVATETTMGSRDLALRRRTLLARCIAARDMHVYTLAFVATFGEEGEDGGGDILAARQLGVLYKRYKVLAVLTARIVHGASWAQVAEWLGVKEDTARALFERAEQRWRDSDPAPWAPILDERFTVDGASPIEIRDEDVPRLAAELDAYYVAHTDDLTERRAYTRAHPHRLLPVSDGLPR
jgi:hypothetical protein